MKSYILEEAIQFLRVIYENLISQECIFKIDEFGGVKCKMSFKFIVTLRYQLFGWAVQCELTCFSKKKSGIVSSR